MKEHVVSMCVCVWGGGGRRGGGCSKYRIFITCLVCITSSSRSMNASIYNCTCFYIKNE